MKRCTYHQKYDCTKKSTNITPKNFHKFVDVPKTTISCEIQLTIKNVHKTNGNLEKHNKYVVLKPPSYTVIYQVTDIEILPSCIDCNTISEA